MTEKGQETMPEELSIMLKFQKFQSEYLGPFLEVVHFDLSDRSDQICCFILTNCFIILLLFSIGESRKGIENDKNHSFQLTKFKSLDRKKIMFHFPWLISWFLSSTGWSGVMKGTLMISNRQLWSYVQSMTLIWYLLDHASLSHTLCLCTRISVPWIA